MKDQKDTNVDEKNGKSFVKKALQKVSKVLHKEEGVPLGIGAACSPPPKE